MPDKVQLHVAHNALQQQLTVSSRRHVFPLEQKKEAMFSPTLVKLVKLVDGFLGKLQEVETTKN